MRAVAWWVSFAALLVLAGWFRVAYPGVVDFDGDLAGRYGGALDILHGKALPLVGRELSGLVDRGRHGPFMAYLEAVPFVFSRNPLALAWFVAAAHVAGVACLGLLGRDAVGPLTGWIAALLMAANPFLAYWTRVVTNTSYLPFFVPLLYLLLWRALARGSSRALAMFIVVAAASSQFHLQVLNVLPAALVLWCLFRPRLDWRWLLLGVCVAILLYLPLPIHALRTGDWDVVRGWGDILFAGGVGHGERDWRRVLEPYRALREGHSYQAFAAVAPAGRLGELYDSVSPQMWWVAVIATDVAALGALLALVRSGAGVMRSERWRGTIFLLALLTIESAMLVTIRSTYYDRYNHLVFPLICLAIGAGLEICARAIPWRLARGIVVGVFVAGMVSVAFVWTALGTQLLRASHDSGLLLGPRPSFERQLVLARRLVEECGIRDRDDASRRIISTGGDEWGIAELVGYVVATGGRPQPARVPGDWLVRVEADPAVAGTMAKSVTDWPDRPDDDVHFVVPPVRVVAYRPRIEMDRVRVMVQPSDPRWPELAYDDAGWVPWLPWNVGAYADRWIGVRIPIQLSPTDAGRDVVVASRACVARGWLDGALVYEADCPSERRTVEVDRDLQRVHLATPATNSPEHLLALEMRVRDKWYDVRLLDERPPEPHE